MSKLNKELAEKILHSTNGNQADDKYPTDPKITEAFKVWQEADKKGRAELIEQHLDEGIEAYNKTLTHLLHAKQNDGGDFYSYFLCLTDLSFIDTRIDTAAVSIQDRITLHINPYFYCKVMVADLLAEIEEGGNKTVLKERIKERQSYILIHELKHLIYDHLGRHYDFNDPKIANLAMDCVVNSEWTPEMWGNLGVFCESFDFEDKTQTADYYYKRIIEWMEENREECNTCGGTGKTQPQEDQGDQQDQDQGQGDQQQQGQGQEEGDGDGQQQDQGGNQQGQGEGEGEDCPDCGGSGHNGNGKPLPQSFDDHSGWEDDDKGYSKEMKDAILKDAIKNAAEGCKDIGRLPQMIQDAIAAARHRPQVSWKRYLKQFVAKCSSSTLDRTKKRYSKRYRKKTLGGGFEKCRPGTRFNPKLRIAVATDVSGSVTDSEYKTFFNEIFAIAKIIGDIEVIEWDTEITGIHKLKGYKPEVTRTGSGGTNPTAAIKYVNDKKNQIDGVIFFTDGGLYGEETEGLRLPALWVLTPNGEEEPLKKYKGRIIKIPKEVA